MKLTHKKRNILAAIGGAILLAALIVAGLALTSCSILNLGGTGEDGEPKTGLDARNLIRSVGDAALQTWSADTMQRTQNAQLRAAISALDANDDGVLTLAEFEGNVNIEDPNQVTMLLLIAVEVYRAKPR